MCPYSRHVHRVRHEPFFSVVDTISRRPIIPTSIRPRPFLVWLKHLERHISSGGARWKTGEGYIRLAGVFNQAAQRKSNLGPFSASRHH